MTETIKKAIVFDRRNTIPTYQKDAKDLEIERLQVEVASLKNQIAHLQWVTAATSIYDHHNQSV